MNENEKRRKKFCRKIKMIFQRTIDPQCTDLYAYSLFFLIYSLSTIMKLCQNDLIIKLITSPIFCLKLNIHLELYTYMYIRQESKKNCTELKRDAWEVNG